jgi:5-(carboxyamino)imidazole ribonucleotide mutase
VISAHRTPERSIEYARTARERGLKVIIAGAGGAAHLPGVIAALTALPVIGVPINSKINGIDSLYSIAQMPSGIPVATVAIDGALNAGILAAQILATSREDLYTRLLEYKEELKNKVELKSAKLEEIGYQKYLNESQKVAH